MLPDTKDRRVHQQRISDVQSYIRDHLAEPLNREVLAAVACFSIPHLHRIFATCTGESIAAHIRRVRLIRAGQKLLMGAIDISEIALAAGYSTHAAFSKAFRQQFGLSPSEFRRLHYLTALQILRKE